MVKAEPQITHVDQYYAPPGEPITVTGTGFTNTIEVSLVFAYGNRAIAQFEVVDDTEMIITMPNLHQGSREFLIVIETSDGSTIGLPDGFREYTGDDYDAINGKLIVKSGATLQADDIAEQFIFVETGGYLDLSGGHAICQYLVAADGAIIDFGSDPSTMLLVYLSPETIVLGEPRKNEPPITLSSPINPSFGIGFFSKGLPLNISIIGEGSVVREPDLNYYHFYQDVTFTAAPGPGQTFSGWSGDITSTDSSISFHVSLTPQELTATFSPGYVINLAEVAGVTVTRAPDKPAYQPGEQLVLTATVEPGYEFLGWNGDASGSRETLTLTMTDHQFILPMVRASDYEDLPLMTAVSNYNTSANSPITVTGENLSAIDTVRLSWIGPVYSLATPTSSSEGEVTFPMPNLRNPGRPYHLLIGGTDGYTCGIYEDYFEYAGEEELDPHSLYRAMVVKAGAKLTQPFDSHIVYVEAGGILAVDGRMDAWHIYVEDGAVLDIRETNISHVSIYRSPGAIIPVEPDYVENDIQLDAPLRPSYQINAFEESYTLTLNVVGEGSVTKSPDYSAYPLGDEVTLTAVPNPGANFIGWSGDILSSNPAESIHMHGDRTVTATFSAGWDVQVNSYDNLTVTKSPEQVYYSTGAEVSLAAAPDAFSEFLGWVGDVQSTDNPLSITVSGNMRVYPVARPFAYADLPRIESLRVDTPIVGQNFTVTGSGFTNTQSVRFRWLGPIVEPAEFTIIDDSSLSVVMPELTRPNRTYQLEIETAVGTTFSIPSDSVEISDHSAPAPLVDAVVVRYGGLLTDTVDARYIFVEAGGIISLDGGTSPDVIVAEAGAVIDLRQNSSPISGGLIYHKDAIILGDLPAESTRLDQPLRFSTAAASVRPTYPLAVLAEGPGSVSISPMRESYAYGDTVNLTAVPDAGAHFIRWVGSRSSLNLDTEVTIREDTTLTARFSFNPNYLTDWRTTHFTAEELGDLSISGFDADPDKDQLSNAAEYAFGRNPRNDDTKDMLGLYSENDGGDLRYFAYFLRPETAADTDYSIQISSDLLTWQHNDDGSGKAISRELSVDPVGNGIEKVTLEIFPESPVIFLRIRVNIMGEL